VYQIVNLVVKKMLRMMVLDYEIEMGDEEEGGSEESEEGESRRI
jgi:hypothetical protein